MTATQDPDDGDENIRGFRRGLLADLSSAVGDARNITLARPLVEYRGTPDDDPEFEMMRWWVDISMAIHEDENWDDDKRLNVGFLELWTLPLDGSTANTLDAISADTAEYLLLLSDGDLSEDVAEQFDIGFAVALLILNRAYVDPAFRGYDVGAWAVAQAVRHLTYGSSQVLVVAYPTPTEDRPGVTLAAGADALARYWAKTGLEPIEACPKLVGQTTAANALDDARHALADVADVEVTLAVSDLVAPGPGEQEGE